VQVSSPSEQAGTGLVELYELDDNGRTANLSTRARVGAGDRVLLGGIVIRGVAHKRTLIRAIGPALAGLGVANTLSDPVLTIYSGSTELGANDRWSENENAHVVAAAGERVGAVNLAPNSEDAALLITLAPGAYTVEVRGKGEEEGIVLLEIYEVP
jgi:hypothetical protein